MKKLKNKRINIKKIAYFSTAKCNSKCVMCNIHKSKKTPDLKPTELKKILKDPLFKNVSAIGVSGGEPSLHTEWKEICNSIFDCLPKLKSISITTNCVNKSKSIELLEYYNKKSEEFNIKFVPYISLDGIGKIHDKVRGIEGNFNNVVDVISRLKEKNIKFTSACTISKENIHDIYNLRDFCKKNKIDIRFRLASKIQRLYNENAKTFHDLNKEEKRLLERFFNEEILEILQKKKSDGLIKNIFNFEDRAKKNRYAHIINMLNGGNRKIACPHSAREAVCLDNDGGLMYCSVDGKIVGNCRKKSCKNIYFSEIEHLEEIIKNKCGSCSHDITK